MVISARAYAKINLFLDITGKRPNGYHDLDTVMQSVSLFDEITVSSAKRGITVACNKEDLSGEDNIVYKTCKEFFKLCGKEFGVNIHIEKNIPVAAGLGGGSADAAAVILILNKMIGCGFSAEQLIPLAASLGADVPFFLTGGTAKAQGIGDILESKPSKTLHYVLVKEGEKQSTGKMYSLLDSAEYQKTGDIDVLLSGLEKGNIPLISKNLFNAFEYCWDFEKLKSPFNSFKPSAVFLSGSGPTVCGLFSDEAAAKECESALRSLGINAFYAKTVPFGVELV